MMERMRRIAETVVPAHFCWMCYADVTMLLVE
jgi:hypothetical protein